MFHPLPVLGSKRNLASPSYRQNPVSKAVKEIEKKSETSTDIKLPSQKENISRENRVRENSLFERNGWSES